MGRKREEQSRKQGLQKTIGGGGLGEQRESCSGGKTQEEGGEDGEEEGGVCREDEEHDDRRPQGSGAEAGHGGGQAGRGHRKGRGEGRQVPGKGLHPEEAHGMDQLLICMCLCTSSFHISTAAV